MYSSVKRTTLILLILSAVLGSAGSVWATNGYFAHGYSVKAKGMAGVATAVPHDALSAAANPALMVKVGNRYDLNISLFNPNRKYTITGAPSGYPNTFPLAPGEITSDSKAFFIPALAANWMVTPKASLGFSVYGNGGMNTDYDTKTYDHPAAPVTAPTGVNLEQLFVAGTFAYEVLPQHSLGITGIFAYQKFRAQGLQAFAGFSSAPDKLTDNGHDNANGFGFRVGYYGEPTPSLSIGLSYQPEIDMGEFDDYAGLFAERGDFNIPANWSIGIAFKPHPEWTFGVDIQQIYYSDIRAVGNPMNPQNFAQGMLLGNTLGSGFGWEDMMVFKFGLEWRGIVGMPLRFGYSYGEQPIPTDEVMFNILAPGVIEHHITFGFSRKFCKGKELSFAVTRALPHCVEGDNPMEYPGQQQIELEMNQWEFTLGFSF